jgi:hypothetical protein
MCSNFTIDYHIQINKTKGKMVTTITIHIADLYHHNLMCMVMQSEMEVGM